MTTKRKKKKKSPTQKSLLDEIRNLRKKLNKKHEFKDPNRAKTNIIRTLRDKPFKSPYTYLWWRKYREKEIETLFPDGFCCPQCGSTGTAVLQHTWHPRPLRALSTEWWSNQTSSRFMKLIPEYVRVQAEDKNSLNKNDYKRWCWHANKTKPSYQESEFIKYGLAKAKSLFALAYFTPDKILHAFIDEMERYIELRCEDYKYVCNSCAFVEDKSIIEGGRLVEDVPYFLLDKECQKRDVLAQALMEKCLENL
jgi:hypothetical protein